MAMETWRFSPTKAVWPYHYFESLLANVEQAPDRQAERRDGDGERLSRLCEADRDEPMTQTQTLNAATALPESDTFCGWLPRCKGNLTF